MGAGLLPSSSEGPTRCSASSRRRRQQMLRSESGPIEITAPTQRARRSGLRIHQCLLRPDEITSVRGIPTTTAARTMIDLAAVLPRHRLERAATEMEHRRLYDPTSLGELL